MSQQTAPCPNCRMTNSYKSVNCLECGQQLPWGASVLAAQQQAQAAQQAAMAAQQAAMTAQAQQQAARAQKGMAPQGTVGASTTFVTPRSAGLDLTADSIKDYSAFGSSFLGETTFDNVEPGGAWFIGGVTSLLFVVCAGWGVYQWWQKILAPFAALANALNGTGAVGTPPSSGFNASLLMKCGLVSLAFLVGMLLLGTILRVIASRDDKGNIGDDLFVTGIALLPLGLLVAASSFIGANHQTALNVIGLFAFSYAVTLLHYGYTKVSHIKAAVATFAIPLFLFLSTWFCQFLMGKLLR